MHRGYSSVIRAILKEYNIETNLDEVEQKVIDRSAFDLNTITLVRFIDRVVKIAYDTQYKMKKPA